MTISRGSRRSPTVLDVSALIIAYGDGTAKWQAQLTFAISRHAVVDLAEVLRVPPSRPPQDRLPPEDVAEVRNLLVECGASTKCSEAGDIKLNELREMYEPYLNGLSSRLLMPLPTWGVGQRSLKIGSDRRGEKSLQHPETREVRAFKGESGHF